MNNVLRTIAVAIAAVSLAGGGSAFADSSVKKVKGNYTYYGDKNDSPAMCKRKALEGARLDAISSEFGTIVSQDVLQADRVGSDGENSKFLSLSSTEVKGEWVADDGDPVYVVSLGNDDCLIVNCRVSGSAKAISNDAVDFEAVALRNGNSKGNASTEYHQGDQLNLYFTAPVDGYLAVFLMLENGEVIKMLPYRSDSRQEASVKKDHDYVFFDDSKAAGDFGEIDSFEIATDGEIEFNKLYVLFSPNSFSAPVMNKPSTPGGLPYIKEDDFSKWLVKNRKNDPKMGVKQINLKLFPN